MGTKKVIKNTAKKAKKSARKQVAKKELVIYVSADGNCSLLIKGLTEDSSGESFERYEDALKALGLNDDMECMHDQNVVIAKIKLTINSIEYGFLQETHDAKFIKMEGK